jgi:hypothetical protein
LKTWYQFFCIWSCIYIDIYIFSLYQTRVFFYYLFDIYMTAPFGYAILGLCVLIGFFGALIGKEKMTKIILGSTCLIPWMLGVSYVFHAMVGYFTTVWSSFGTIAGPQWVGILTNSEPTVLAVVLLGTLMMMMSRVRLHVDYVLWWYDNLIASYIFLIPSMICTLAGMAGIVLLGINVFTIESMQLLAQTFTSIPENYIFFTGIPYYLMIQSISMIVILSQSTLTISPSDGYSMGE